MIGPSLGRFIPRPGSLGARSIRAGVWSLGQVGALHVLRLGSNLIMTRLLVPEAFGLISLVATIITAFALFSDIGISRSIIREPKGEDPFFLRVAWTVKIFRGSLIGAGVIVSALVLGVLGPTFSTEGSVYADPRLPWLIAISALAPILQGVESTRRELALRRIHMGRLAVLEIGAQILSILSMIAFASLSPTVWALLAGMLVGSLAKSAGSHIFLAGPTMRPAWDKDIADRLWQYGKWLMGSSVFTFVSRNADRLILAALLSATAFGIYTIARIWFDASQQVVRQLANQVGFSTIGEVVRERPADVPRLFRKFMTIIDAMVLFAFFTLLFFGRGLIDLLYTDDYASAGSYLQILAIGVLVLRFDPVGDLVMNTGNSRALMITSVIRAVAICITLPVAFHLFGLTGALYATVLSPLASLPYILQVAWPILGRQLFIDITWAVVILVYTVFQGFLVL